MAKIEITNEFDITVRIDAPRSSQELTAMVYPVTTDLVMKVTGRQLDPTKIFEYRGIPDPDVKRMILAAAKHYESDTKLPFAARQFAIAHAIVADSFSDTPLYLHRLMASAATTTFLYGAAPKNIKEPPVIQSPVWLDTAAKKLSWDHRYPRMVDIVVDNVAEAGAIGLKGHPGWFRVFGASNFLLMESAFLTRLYDGPSVTKDHPRQIRLSDTEGNTPHL